VQLVFLYGPPAVGKYTIGVELAARTGFRLFHNHLTVNLVSAVFDRDSEVWLRLLRGVRRDILTEAAHHRVSLIMTGCSAVRRTTPQPGERCSSPSAPRAAWFTSSS
jgi:hypothetical protein